MYEKDDKYSFDTKLITMYDFYLLKINDLIKFNNNLNKAIIDKYKIKYEDDKFIFINNGKNIINYVLIQIVI